MYQYHSNIYLNHISLNVADLTLETNYYVNKLGLDIIKQDENSVDLGIQEKQTILIRLIKQGHAQNNAAGLYHLAIVLPSRSDLGNFLAHVLENQIPLVGASNHGYSEAIYLEDPEGNGVEVYWDKDVNEWDIQGDKIIGITEQMDAQGVLDSSTSTTQPYKMPVGTRMGHIHLTVSSVSKAVTFYEELFQMTEKFAIPTASWISSGNYHHHFAFNSWKGTNLISNSPEFIGLLEMNIMIDDLDYFNQTRLKAEKLNALQQSSEPNKLIVQDIFGNQLNIHLTK